ncbi:MAG TPA: hypothetical protein VMV49_16885 [Candidatus Deferrimicrobium sp.]|nr:hypothetical protein [Candidatus Deferrimicrobium sp.]
MGSVMKGNRLSPEAIQKINELVNAFIERNIQGQTIATLNETKLIKQAKVEVNKQIAPYLKQGIESSVKNLVDKTVDETIINSLNVAKKRLKPK